MLTNSSFSNNPREANEEHDAPDIQHASYLWTEGALKEMRNDRRQNSGLCNSGVQALSTTQSTSVGSFSCINIRAFSPAHLSPIQTSQHQIFLLLCFQLVLLQASCHHQQLCQLNRGPPPHSAFLQIAKTQYMVSKHMAV